MWKRLQKSLRKTKRITLDLLKVIGIAICVQLLLFAMVLAAIYNAFTKGDDDAHE